jgi:phosphoenolpyruvate-protein phosphotransferase
MARKVIKGNCIGPGRATGKLVCLGDTSRLPAKKEVRKGFRPEEEFERFKRHAALLCEELREMGGQLRDDSLHQEAEIFTAHAALLEDEEFHQRVHDAIHDLEHAAEEAVEKVLGDMATMMEEMDDPVFNQRAADFRDLELQLRRRLLGRSTAFVAQKLQGVKDPVVAVPELTPSLVLKSQRLGAKAFVVEEGTGYSHGSVLAKSFNECVLRIPSIDSVRQFEGERVVVDAMAGQLLLDPTDEEVSEMVWSPGKTSPKENWKSMARLWLNILRPEQLQDYDWRGIEGVGLYRTETIFMEKEREFPTEEEQIKVYRDLFEACPGKTVTVRTLDIGGDKPVAYLSLGPQENPQLGLRAHRLYHFHPEILITQIRAILRAAVHCDKLRILYPMIESLDQWEFVRGLTDHAIETLEKDSVEFQEKFERGILVETPSAVWSFPALIEAADFASIGTNDLVQYLFAVDRNAASVAAMYSCEHPIVLQVLRQLVEQANEVGKPIAICGEMAADLRALPMLVGVGLRDLSVTPRAVPILERRLQEHDLDDCERLAQLCLKCHRTSEVRDILDDWEGVPHSKGAPPERDIIDPICKEAVDPESTPYTVSVGGVSYYFCSNQCLNVFTRASSSETGGGR